MAAAGLQLAEAGEANLECAVTPEEIAIFTVAEGLSDVELAQLYIGSGRAVQQLAVISNLPGLVRAAGRSAWAAVARGVVDVAGALDSDGQVVVAEALAMLARERLLLPVDITEAILPLALAGVGEGSGAGPAAQAAWLVCLGEAAGAVEPGTLHSRVLPAVLARGPGHAPRERCLCAQLLGAIAPHAAAEDLRRTMLRLGAALAQDTEWQVRHAMAQQLPALVAAAETAGLDLPAIASVLGDLWALLEDEEALVRAAAWRSLSAVLQLVPPDLRRSRLLPLLLRQCRDTDHHAEVQRALAAGFGSLMGRLVADMEGDADVTACLGCYRGLAWRHDHATRLACAAAFPSVLRAGTARRYGSHLHDVLLRLAGDAGAEVRLAVASALPEVAAALGRERCCQMLRQPVAALLQDERPEVAAALLSRLLEVFAHFNPSGATAATAAAAEEQRVKVFAPFVEPLLRAEAASGAAWRLQLAWLRAGTSFPAFFTPDALHDRFLPLALKYMAEGAAALRDAAAAAAAAMWRALRKPAHRSGLYARLIHDFAQAKSFRLRMAFLDFCRHTQRHFSCKFVKAYLMEPALALAYDRVANVRLHVAAALPALKVAVALPDDVQLLEVLNSGMSHLITDGDADVRQAARKANDEFKRLPVRMSCGALESSSEEVKAFEAADAARAEAERGFTFDADQLERIRSEIAAFSERLRPADTRLALALPSTRGEGGASGSSSRLGTSRNGSGGRGPGASAKARGVAAALAAARHLRTGSDAPEVVRREKGLLSDKPQGRSASADGQQRPSGGYSKGPSGLKAATQQRCMAAPAALHSGRQPAAATAAGDARPDSTADSPAAGPTEQPQQQAHSLGGSSSSSSSISSRLGRPSPGAAARTVASANRMERTLPSAAGGSRRQTEGAQAAEEQAGELATSARSPASPSDNLVTSRSVASPAVGSVIRRPSFRGAASRAAAEVQHLASKLKSALLSSAPGGHAAAAARPAGGSPGSTLPAKAAADAVGIRVTADASRGRAAAVGRSGMQHAGGGR